MFLVAKESSSVKFKIGSASWSFMFLIYTRQHDVIRRGLYDLYLSACASRVNRCNREMPSFLAVHANTHLMKCPNDLCLVTRMMQGAWKAFSLDRTSERTIFKPSEFTFFPIIILSPLRYRGKALSRTRAKWEITAIYADDLRKKKEEGKAGGVRRTNEQTLKYKTSWKINVSCSHTISPLFRFFAAYKWAEELFYTFSFSFAAQLSASLLLHSLPCFAKRREENQKRYLNFYTQLIWEWLFKGDVYNTILTDPSTQHGRKATPFKMPWISLFVLPLSTEASDFTESHCFVIALRIINSWQR